MDTPKAKELDFGSDAVANAYHEVLVPALFEPWAARLVEQMGPWEGRSVIDLAVGTGVVSRRLGDAVGAGGKVIAVDINAAMLARAKQHCSAQAEVIEFVESSAAPLALPDGCADVLVCQQGFQFFPDRGAAADEMFRVLRPGGQLFLSAWRPVEECAMFNALCEALAASGQQELSQMMRSPFQDLAADSLTQTFKAAGFGTVETSRQALDLELSAGVPHGIKMAYATPIGPKLLALEESVQASFQEALGTRLQALSAGGTNMGPMTTLVLRATKSN